MQNILYRGQIHYHSLQTLYVWSPQNRGSGEKAMIVKPKEMIFLVAYDQLMALLNLTLSPQQQILVVQIERRIKGEEKSQYLIVRQYMQGSPSLPQEIFNGESLWSFSLTRDRGCDGTLEENSSDTPLPRWKRAPGAETELLTVNNTLPCYVLDLGKLKRVAVRK
jgi:hypothetical protein